MDRKTGILLGVGAVAVGGVLLATGLVDASTLPAGTAVTVDAVDNAAASGWTWIVTWGGRLLAIGLGYSGLSDLGSGQGRGAPGKKLGGAAASAFVPGIVTNLMTAAPAATAAGVQLVTRSQEVLAGLSGAAILQEPITWLTLAATAAAVAWSQTRRQDVSRLA